jgi:hypothetical protein
MAGKTPWGSECVVGLGGFELGAKRLWAHYLPSDAPTSRGAAYLCVLTGNRLI